MHPHASKVLPPSELSGDSEINSFTGKTPVLLVNLRAEGDAKALEKIVQQAVAEQSEVVVKFQNQAAFQPGEPVPVHRIAAA